MFAGLAAGTGPMQYEGENDPIKEARQKRAEENPESVYLPEPSKPVRGKRKLSKKQRRKR